ncbi:hypothetical protein KIN20_028554 [Parelaphostrongylus tenuis]|uniref:Uncharacterized protein n=1 Tax=Parelaphostrongylus tenuis TaxID=148309 RepID=A0AAD5WEW3_PARTN|nr:hypothetical protein KIN20_028554 [Parelaphostrongylus tenuis]
MLTGNRDSQPNSCWPRHNDVDCVTVSVSKHSCLSAPRTLRMMDDCDVSRTVCSGSRSDQ